MPHAMGEWVCVRHVPDNETKTASGIILKKADAEREGSVVFLATGELMSVGSEVLNWDETATRVLYNPYDANSFKEGVHEYHLVHYKHIRGYLA